MHDKSGHPVTRIVCPDGHWVAARITLARDLTTELVAPGQYCPECLVPIPADTDDTLDARAADATIHDLEALDLETITDGEADDWIDAAEMTHPEVVDAVLASLEISDPGAGPVRQLREIIAVLIP